MAERRAWQGELADAGWAGLHWSKSAGGREASFTQQVLYYAELTRRGLPPLPGNRGLMLVGPTLIAHGSERQKLLLAPTRRADILRSEEHTSELHSLMRISYAVFCLKKK